jgi:hypothetical protein
MKRHASWQRLVAVMGVTLLVAVGSSSHNVSAHQNGFAFTPLVFLNDATPGGEKFLDAFESSRINDRGDDRGQVVFGATLSDERGVLVVATPKSHRRDD